MLRLTLAVVLLVHGAVHVMGFLVPWKLATIEGLPYTTALLAGNWEIGSTAMQVLGVLMLGLMLGFLAAAFGIVAQRGWWWAAALLSATFSLVLTALQWPEAQFGVYINIVLLAILVVVRTRPAGVRTVSAE